MVRAQIPASDLRREETKKKPWLVNYTRARARERSAAGSGWHEQASDGSFSLDEVLATAPTARVNHYERGWRGIQRMPRCPRAPRMLGYAQRANRHQRIHERRDSCASRRWSRRGQPRRPPLPRGRHRGRACLYSWPLSMAKILMLARRRRNERARCYSHNPQRRRCRSSNQRRPYTARLYPRGRPR